MTIFLLAGMTRWQAFLFSEFEETLHWYWVLINLCGRGLEIFQIHLKKGLEEAIFFKWILTLGHRENRVKRKKVENLKVRT